MRVYPPKSTEPRQEEIDKRMKAIPAYDSFEFAEKKRSYCLCIFVINEGEKLIKQLATLYPYHGIVDVVIADGGSTDGSTETERLKGLGVNTLLVKTGPGKLGSQMRMAFAWAAEKGYKGVVVIDGNGKDGVEAIPDFVKALEKGYDHIQGSRFISGGHHANTPLSRLIGVKLLHAPLISLAAGFKYTDTTNGFRAYSMRFLTDEKINLFREVFSSYELHYYMAIEAPCNGFRALEIPVSRVYPKGGKIPTKISPVKGSIDVLSRLFKAVSGGYREKTADKLEV